MTAIYKGIDEPPPETPKERETREWEWTKRVDEMVGCNMRGRLLYAYDLIKEDKPNEAAEELWKLLEFFPVDKP